MENIINKLKWFGQKPVMRIIVPSLVIILGVWARIWWIRTIPTEQLYDFDAYYRIAKNIYDGKGFTYEGAPIAFQGMFYSWSLGLFFKLVGSASIALAKWLNIFYSLMTILLTWGIVYQFTKGRDQNEKIALVAMAFVSFLPHHIAYCNTTGTEVIMAFLLAFLIYVQCAMNRSWQRLVILGILTGICALTKPFYMAYPVILGLSDWITTKNFKKSVTGGLLIWLVMAAVIAPWTLRNYRAFGRFIPISYNSGFNLYINNNQNNIHGGWMSFDDLYKTPELQEKIDKHLENGSKSVKLASDIELDFKPEAVKWIKENPMAFIKLGVIRIHSTYFNGSWDIDSWTMNQLSEKPTDLTAVEVGRNFNAFRAVNDILLSILSGFSFIFVLLGIPKILKAVFIRKQVLSISSVILFMNLAFPSLVFFVYEGQPRYNQSILFLMIIACVLMVEKMTHVYGENVTIK
jgi:hypothetical protein